MPTLKHKKEIMEKYHKVELWKMGYNLVRNTVLDEEILDFVSEATITIFESMREDDKDFIRSWIRALEEENSDDEDSEEASEEKWDSELNNIVKNVFCRICGAYSGDSEHICNILLSE